MTRTITAKAQENLTHYAPKVLNRELHELLPRQQQRFYSVCKLFAKLSHNIWSGGLIYTDLCGGQTKRGYVVSITEPVHIKVQSGTDYEIIKYFWDNYLHLYQYYQIDARYDEIILTVVEHTNDKDEVWDLCEEHNRSSYYDIGESTLVKIAR